MVEQRLTLHFPALAEIAHKGVRRAAAFVAMGQKAWSDENIKSAVVEAPFSFQLLPDPLPKELADDVRASFRLWVIGNAITELVQALSLFADDYFRIAALVPHNNARVPQQALDRIRKCHADTNLHSKLTRIADEWGLNSPLLDHSDGWTRARNTLAHNNGIVRDRDFTPNTQALTVSWKQFEFSIDGKKIENIVGHTVEKGGVLGFSLVRGSKDFQIGSGISFSEQEILNICLTCYLHIGTSVTALEQYVHKFVAPPKPEEEANPVPAR